jgi:hypothetical protein
VLRFLTRAVDKEKKKKWMRIGKEGVKLSLFTVDMILYLKDSKESMKKLLDLMNTFNKVAGYKINIKSQEFFYVPIMNRLRKKSGNQSHLQ